MANWKPPNDRCEKCQFYRTIDSGYGECVRYPPRNVLAQWFPHPRCLAIYPSVRWLDMACGEYIPKSGKGGRTNDDNSG